ncbi:MAG: hypothetical protein HY287_06665 [Planctomycetes bacterium]|nr:hypothetical protein [Planctomycetota bacterium]
MYSTPGTEKRYFAARHAFQSAIVGHIALKNMLALASDDDLDNRLPTFSPEEFKEWLSRIDKEGSVIG